EARRLNLRNKAFIGGEFAPAASGKTFNCTSPRDGSVLAEVAECDKEDIDRAVKAARKAFESGVWANKAPKSRKRVMLKFADLIERNTDELALLETLDMGKPISNARNGDLRAVIECVRWYAEALDKLYDEIAPSPRTALALIEREPIGVVGAVVPWNFPLLMAAWKFAPAIAAGNSLVLKPAEQSPLTALRVAELAAAAGAADGIFYNSGQVCNAASRLLVEDKIHDRFLSKVAELAQQYRPGDPLDEKTKMGAMVDVTQTKRVLNFIEKGQQEGAALVAGGHQVRQERGGCYIQAAILDLVEN